MQLKDVTVLVYGDSLRAGAALATNEIDYAAAKIVQSIGSIGGEVGTENGKGTPRMRYYLICSEISEK